jgi:hypothetical protein
MSAEAQLTPMMAQYRRIKGELPKDTLILLPLRATLKRLVRRVGRFLKA